MKKIDLSAFMGIFVAICLLAITTSLSGNILSFIDIPSFLLIFGGTIAVSMASLNLEDIKISFKNIFYIIFLSKKSLNLISDEVLVIAESCYKKNLFEIDKTKILKYHGEFFRKYFTLVVEDGERTSFSAIMEEEIKSTIERFQATLNLIKRAGEIAPSLGLIGTIIGLVQMLSNLDNVKLIGPAMAVALLTTFYGAILSYLILFPLAARFEKSLQNEYLKMKIYFLAVKSIAYKEHPTQLEYQLNSLLPSEQKVDYFN